MHPRAVYMILTIAGLITPVAHSANDTICGPVTATLEGGGAGTKTVTLSGQSRTQVVRYNYDVSLELQLHLLDVQEDIAQYLVTGYEGYVHFWGEAEETQGSNVTNGLSFDVTPHFAISAERGVLYHSMSDDQVLRVDLELDSSTPICPYYLQYYGHSHPHSISLWVDGFGFPWAFDDFYDACWSIAGLDFTGPQVFSYGSVIGATGGPNFAYNSTYGGSWRMMAPGAYVQMTFSVGADPEDASLHLNHLSSADGACPGGGYSPIDVLVNGQAVKSHYDPAQNHGGTHGYVDDIWEIGGALRRGANTVRIAVCDDLCTHYWISLLEVAATTCTADGATCILNAKMNIRVEDPIWVDEADEMVLPYDSVDLAFEVINDGSTDADIVLVFGSNNDRVWFSPDDTCRVSSEAAVEPSEDSENSCLIHVAAGSHETVYKTIRITGTSKDGTETEVMQTVVRDKGRLSLEDTIKVSAQCPENPVIEKQFVLSPYKTEGGDILEIQYPAFKELAMRAGAPVPPDIGEYYKEGDSDFHHPDDPLVRKYAIEAAALDTRALKQLNDYLPEDEQVTPNGDPIFPDSIAESVQNIFTWLGYLPDDADGLIMTDQQFTSAAENNDLRAKMREYGAGGFLCIGQAYLVTSFARTIGLPARELTTALAEYAEFDEVNQIDRFNYEDQEAGADVWYDGGWHLVDTFANARNLGEYRPFGSCARRTWYAFDRQRMDCWCGTQEPREGQSKCPNTTPDGQLGGNGHDFTVMYYEYTGGVWVPLGGVPKQKDQWKFHSQYPEEQADDDLVLSPWRNSDGGN